MTKENEEEAEREEDEHERRLATAATFRNIFAC